MFYERLKTKATSLLTKYGKQGTIQDVNGLTLGNVNIVEGDAKVENIPQTVVEQTDKIVYVDAESIVPTDDHYLSMDGQAYKVVFVKPYSPASLTLLYQLFLKK